MTRVNGSRRWLNTIGNANRILFKEHIYNRAICHVVWSVRKITIFLPSFSVFKMEKEHRSTFGSLPIELIEIICEYCDDTSLLNSVALVSKAFWMVVSPDTFWKRWCEIKQIKFIEKNDSKSWKYNYQRKILTNNNY